MNKYTSLLLAAILALCGCGSSKETVCSPDNRLSFSLKVNEGKMYVSAEFGSETVLADSPVGIVFADGMFGDSVRILESERRSVTDDYRMHSGKTGQVHCESNEVRIRLADSRGREVDMFLRAFNDGAAYRYLIPEQESMTELAISREIMELNIPGDPAVKMMSLPNFTSSHENFYRTGSISSYEDSLLFDMPALVSFPDGKCMAVTESNVVDYAGMVLMTVNGTLQGVLSPRPDGSGLSVTGELPRRSPWRVFQVSDRLGGLLESDIVTALADPCMEEDLSWLDPGLSTWPWWNAYQAPESLKKGDISTINRNINRYYIDFCAENGIKYHSVTGILKEDGSEICWYRNENSRTGSPGASDDTSRPYKDFDFESLCRYAQDKGVKMRVWVHWKTLDKNIEETFRQYSQWGVHGLMVDYMDRDDEEMIAFQKKVLELAMKYRLHIQFHGSSKPSGLSRTYPCELTRENTLNYETYKWLSEYSGKVYGSEHDLDVAFVRTLAGPADYHLGSFRAVRSGDYSPVSARPVTTSTRSHSLAMYVVLESGLHLVSDAPEAYDGQSGFEFIKDITTAWDETRVILAELDGYLVVARRKGVKWYMGGIGNRESRDLSVPLGFLDKGEYSCTVYRDGADSDKDPNMLVKEESVCTSGDALNVRLAPHGGFAAVLAPVNGQQETAATGHH